MFEISVKNITLMTILALAVIMLASGLTFNNNFKEPKVIFKEAPLYKNSKLQIGQDEEFTYTYLMSNNQSINVTYVAIQESGCTRIFISQSVNNTNICIGEWGTDSTGSNVTFADPSFLLFKPWMLALDDSWRWNNSMYIDYGGMVNHMTDNYFRVLRKEQFMNRTAYVVELSTSEGDKEYQWVDAEKRILLKSIGSGYQIELVDD